MLPLYLAADLHSGVRQAGLILGLCAGLEIPLMLAFGALSTRWSLRGLIVAGPVFSVAYLAVAATATHSWVLFAGQVLNATSIAAVQGLGVSYVQDLMPSQPGRASALYSNSFAAGTIMTGPLIATGGVFGYRAAYFIAAGICVLGCGLIALSRPPRAVRAPSDDTGSLAPMAVSRK
jgi:SET family sugar efflux transporter-like MFS transporter